MKSHELWSLGEGDRGLLDIYLTLPTPSLQNCWLQGKHLPGEAAQAKGRHLNLLAPGFFQPVSLHCAEKAIERLKCTELATSPSVLPKQI